MFIDRKTLRLGLSAQMLDEYFSVNDPDLEIHTTWFRDRDMVSFDQEAEDHQIVWFDTLGSRRVGSAVKSMHAWKHFASNPSVLFPEGEMHDGPWTDEAYRLERFKFLTAADTRHMDFYVTDSDFLLKYTPKRSWHVNVITSDEAIAVVGAYLRTRGNYLLGAQADGSWHRSLDRGSFYETLRLSLTGPLSFGFKPNDADLVESMKALGALTYRCEQMLKSRDYALVSLLQPQNDQTLDEALYFFDMLLLTMGGMLDALSKIVDRKLSLGSNDLEIGWNKKKWQKKIKQADRQLYDLIRQGSHWRSFLDLHAVFRNTIHGELISSFHYQNEKEPERSIISLSGDVATRALTAISILGGIEDWRVLESNSRDVWLDIGVAMEKLFEESIGLVNQVAHHAGMAGTERYSIPAPSDCPFDYESKERVAMLAGCYQLRQKRLKLTPPTE